MSIQDDLQDLRSLTMHELVRRYEEAWGKPPRVKHRAYLAKRIAWKIEEARTGGLSKKAKARLEELIADLDINLGEKTKTGVLRPHVRRDATLPPIGTTITRRWKDRDVTVSVREDGFEYAGEIYKSLSAVAREITGSRWNGRLFFGLVKRKKA